MFTSSLLLIGLAACLASPVLPDQQAIGEKIVGGRNGTIEEVPYLVSVLVDGNHHCGGSIVTELWVVSAAHCFSRLTSRYSIRAGSSLTNVGGFIHAVEIYINHPLYQWHTALSYDIAVVKVAEPFHFSAQIQPILLPRELDQLTADDTGLISGYGMLNWPIGPLATVVQLAEVPIIPRDVCRLAYSWEPVTDDMICAGSMEGGVDACQNDSGGPLVVDGILHGIVSWGYRCAVAGYPGVYARVSYFRDWIREQIGPF